MSVAEKIDKVVFKLMYVVSIFAALALIIAALVTFDSKEKPLEAALLFNMCLFKEKVYF